MSLSKVRSAARLAFFVSVLNLALATLHGQTSGFSVLYSFTGAGDGAQPNGPLFVGQPNSAWSGFIYGTATAGGDANAAPCQTGVVGCGTVFQIDPQGSETTLYTFTGGIDGGATLSGVIQDSTGNLYGTTYRGGNVGAGTVFKVGPAGGWSLLYSFDNEATGNYPSGGLVTDGQGNFYGATTAGGNLCYINPLGCGTVFKIDPQGTESMVGAFLNINAGLTPQYSLLLDKKTGHLFGTTEWGGGGESAGNVFEMAQSGDEAVLHSFFANGPDGYEPSSGLTADGKGNLYGVTGYGANNLYGCVYKITGGNVETVVYSFKGGPDGGAPFGTLALDAEGNLYGTASLGGSQLGVCATYTNVIGSGCGVVFKVDPSGNESVLHTFTGGADGASPMSGLVEGKTADGTPAVFGTTLRGGNLGCVNGGGEGCGTVFMLVRH